MFCEPSDFKHLVLNTDVPCVIKNLDINWKCLKSTNLREWCSHMNKHFVEGIPFELGNFKHNQHPQWERCRQSCRMTMKEFLSKYHSNENPEKWATFSYKDLNLLPKECHDGINFDRFGFPSLEYVNFWFGSKAAHTSCHYDSYGCNIVVQVYGRKSWLLFPPQEHLSPTRVPYEESSVYCKENFYSPKCLDQFEKILEPHNVILHPGDALIIPRHWWHYAENLETSLSINTWIPLIDDIHSQIDECIVQTQISRIVNNLTQDLRSAIINPNEMEIEPNHNLQSQLILLKRLLSFAKNRDKRLKNNRFPSKYLSKTEFNQLLEKCKNVVEPLHAVSRLQFFEILKLNSRRFDPTLSDNIDGTSEYQNISAFINSICNPNVVHIVKDNLLNEMVTN